MCSLVSSIGDLVTVAIALDTLEKLVLTQHVSLVVLNDTDALKVAVPDFFSTQPLNSSGHRGSRQS